MDKFREFRGSGSMEFLGNHDGEVGLELLIIIASIAVGVLVPALLIAGIVTMVLNRQKKRG
ncbi:hypothetical protein [Corynebacterium lizhenjunii]|uniref:hypothetical protein n=1 Tax=Corynebacterium lizhenjunii TaxID=2709394 RepID=UPI0013EB3D60|nr:hypothetical protein [Corynebacterium lizhenjunii]